jgi:hypothetical protein
MSSPWQDISLGAIEVSLGSLLYQAKVWEDQAAAMGDITSEADNSRYLDNPGVFDEAIITYNTACSFIAKLCHDSQLEMSKISEALTLSHNTYRETEQEITNQIIRLGI